MTKEVEPLFEYGWWARNEMLKTNKYNLHKGKKRTNRLEFAKFIETHLLEWHKRILKMDWNCLKLFGNSEEDGVWAMKLNWVCDHKVDCGLRKSFKLKCKWHGNRLRECNWSIGVTCRVRRDLGKFL